MQRVSALIPAWDRKRSSGKRSSISSKSSRSSLDKFRGWADKMPIGRLSTPRSAREALLVPATLDVECERAARILRSFCGDGFLVADDRPMTPSTTSSTSTTNKVLKKIPPTIIRNAVGLAVFTLVRTGMCTSAGGSGVLIARKADGTWSPPSGLLLQAASLAFHVGVDAYDCIVVINTFTTLEAFGKSRLTLGKDVALAGGPHVSLGLLENELSWTDLSDTALTYMKAKGQSAEVKLDGTVLSVRAAENQRFYGNGFSVPKILAGDINQSLPQIRPLKETLKAAEGRTDFDAALLELLTSVPAPADALLDSPLSSRPASLSPSFGVPNANESDPYGVSALAAAGLEIREAGTRRRPDSTEFLPSPPPSVVAKFGRPSIDTYYPRSSRGSCISNRTTATDRSQYSDANTQTDLVHTPETTPSPSRSEDGRRSPSVDDIPEDKEPEEADYTVLDITCLRKLSAYPDSDDVHLTASPTTIDPVLGAASSADEELEAADADDEHDAQDRDSDLDSLSDSELDEDAEEPIVYEVATVQSPRMVAAQAVQMKGAVVNIPRRVPPPLPVRSPARLSRGCHSAFGVLSSPLSQDFNLDGQAEHPSTAKEEKITA